MFRSSLVAALSLALGLLAPTRVSAAPAQLPHQGVIIDGFGVPLEGMVTLRFRLYDAPEGGQLLWNDEVDARLEAGRYAVVLGTSMVAPLDDALFDGAPRYLAVAVGSGAELSPRAVIGAVPYALRARYADEARSVSGGIVDATRLSVGGVEVIDTSGAWVAPVPWSALTGLPEWLVDGDADTLGALDCASGEVVVWDGAEWGCGELALTSVNAASVVGQLAVDQLPVGVGGAHVAAGDHTHEFTDLEGVAAAEQLPIGDTSAHVAAGDHTHALSALEGSLDFARVTGSVPIDRLAGDLPLSRTTGALPIERVDGELPLSRTTGTLPLDRTTGTLPLSRVEGVLPIDRTTGSLPLDRTTGNLDASRLSGFIPFNTLPTGTGSNQVAVGNHTHAFSGLTGAPTISQLPVGTTSTTVAAGNHTHAASGVTGVVSFSVLPVGTTSTSLAVGNHTHDLSSLSGTAAVTQLPTGTSGFQVALGNHTHAANAITSGQLDRARLPATVIAPTCSDPGHVRWDGTGWVCDDVIAAPLPHVYERTCGWLQHQSAVVAQTIVGCTPAACADGHADLGVSNAVVDAYAAYANYTSVAVSGTGGLARRVCLAPPEERALAYRTECPWLSVTSHPTPPSIPTSSGSCTPAACATGYVTLGLDTSVQSVDAESMLVSPWVQYVATGSNSRVCLRQ